jgi:hypothetical protein
MNFLEFLGFKKVMEDLEPKNVVKLPVDYVKPAPEPKPKEHYRVGFDDQGMTTLTLIGENGYSMTLSMSRSSCEQLIKMLRATYQRQETEETE